MGTYFLALPGENRIGNQEPTWNICGRHPEMHSIIDRESRKYCPFGFFVWMLVLYLALLGILGLGWVISSNHWFPDCSLDHDHKGSMDAKVQMEVQSANVTWGARFFWNSGQKQSNIIKIIYAMQGYYRTKPMLGSIFEPIFLLMYLNICQPEFSYTVSRGINLLHKMLYVPTEASNIKIKGNLCSYFAIKVILKNCWVQGLNCVSLLANPLFGDKSCTADSPWK